MSSCPVCGGRCRCRNCRSRGVCCACHNHKPSKKMTTEFLKQLEGTAREKLPERIQRLHAQYELRGQL